MSAAPDDDELLAALAQALRGWTEPPPEVVEAAKGLFTWRTVDAELAALTFDSLLDDEPSVVRSTEAPPRMLTFETATLTVEVEVDTGAATPPGRRLVGQLVPAQTAVVELIGSSSTMQVTADDLGRFVLPLAGEPERVTLRFTATDGRAVTIVAVV